MIDFFITGLPGSGLSWIANYLFYAGTTCFLNLDIKPEGGPIGVANSSLALFQESLIKEHPNAKWVLIERDFDDAQRESKEDLCPLYQKQSELILTAVPLRVPYDAFPEAVRDIARYVDGGWVHNEARHQVLIELGSRRFREPAPIPGVPEPPAPTPGVTECLALIAEMTATEPLATRWIHQVIETALVWDHVADRDPIDRQMTDKVFKNLTTEWPMNGFLIRYASSLMPVLSSAISEWQASYLDGMPKHGAYAIYTDVPSAVAYIIGGQDLVDKYMPRIRKLVYEMHLEDEIRDGEK